MGANRELKDLNKVVFTLVNLALLKISSSGVQPFVVETTRTTRRQRELFCQGRTVELCVKVGIPKKVALKYCTPNDKIVTQTLNSQHIKKCAIDVVPMVNNKLVWESRAKSTKVIIDTMRDYGFTCGFDFPFVDSPHFEITNFSGKECKESNTTNELSSAIQKRLKKLGHYNGAVDGKWGVVTTKAINEFLRMKKQKENGCLNCKQLVMLFNE